MLGFFARGKALAANLIVLNDDHLARLQRVNFAKAEVGQRHAFAGGGKKRTFLGVAQRPEAFGIPKDHHVAHGIEENQVVSAVEFLS